MNEGAYLEIQDSAGLLFGHDEAFNGTALERWAQLSSPGGF